VRGALQIAFEQLKARLQAEGLFDPAHKKPVPSFLRGSGLSPRPRRRHPGHPKHHEAPLPFRGHPHRPRAGAGAEAPAEIVEALHHLNELPGIDVIIVARGGGSLEDLMAFNSEGVARAIFASRIPVISAVGHEIDFTIADFVADMRAAHPFGGGRTRRPHAKRNFPSRSGRSLRGL